MPLDDVQLPSDTLPAPRACWPAVFCAVIVVASAVLRIQAARGDFWLDEIWSWFIGVNVSDSRDILLSVHHDNNHYLNTLFIQLLGPDRDLLVYRLPSVLAGIGTVVVAGLIGMRHSRLEGITAALLTGSSYLQVQYSSEARGYGPMVFFALLSVYLLGASLKGSRPILNVLCGLTAVLGFLSHLQFVFCYAGMVSWSLWRLLHDRHHRGRLIRVNLYCHLPPTAFILWLYRVDISRLVQGGGDELRVRDTLIALLSLTVGGPESGRAAAVLAMAVVAAMLAAMILFRRDGSDEWVFYLATIFVAPVVISLVIQQELFFVRYFLVCSMFALLLVNHALVRVGGIRRWGQPLFTLLLLGMLSANLVHVQRLIRLGRGNYQQALRLISEQTRGPSITLASDHPFRNPMVIGFYQLRMDGLKPIVYLHDGQGPPEGPEWIIRHEVQREREPESECSDIFGNRYRLVDQFPYAGLSGWKWIVYRNENRPERDP